MADRKYPPPAEAFEDHVLTRMLAMKPDPHVQPKPKAKKATKKKATKK